HAPRGAARRARAGGGRAATGWLHGAAPARGPPFPHPGEGAGPPPVRPRPGWIAGDRAAHDRAVLADRRRRATGTGGGSPVLGRPARPAGAVLAGAVRPARPPG